MVTPKPLYDEIVKNAQGCADRFAGHAAAERRAVHNLSTLVCILQRSEFCKPNVPHMQVCSELCTSKMCHRCSLLAVLLLITIIPTLKERCRNDACERRA